MGQGHERMATWCVAVVPFTTVPFGLLPFTVCGRVSCMPCDCLGPWNYQF